MSERRDGKKRISLHIICKRIETTAECRNPQKWWKRIVELPPVYVRMLGWWLGVWCCCCLHSISALIRKKDENVFDAKLQCQIVEELQHRYANNNNNKIDPHSLLHLLQIRYTHANCQRRIFNNNFSALLCEISFSLHFFLYLFFVHRHIANRTSHIASSAEWDENFLASFNEPVLVFLLFILLSLYIFEQ